MPKGVPMAEKKRKLLRLYHERKEPFGLKELEKEGGRAGLNEKQVKEINALLLDDNVVSTDKCGQSNIYWSFPAAQGVELRGRVQASKKRLVAVEKALAEAVSAEAAAREGREDIDGRRAEKLREVGDLVARRKALDLKYDAIKENDPAELERVNELAAAFKTNAERWSDNVMNIKAFLVKKKNIAPSQVDDIFKSVGLPKDLDLD
mmetsp:Transcript_38174/g.122533  ORF Transcript_38174/g.122533 Transcript_38174/m.122533 type:complete len:206 (+) Transcript_38174:66-683(+)